MRRHEQRARILIVEDDVHIRTLLTFLLQAIYDLDVVPSADEALRLADQKHFDLFLIDIYLGKGLTGIELLRELRLRPAYSTIPAVACTAAYAARRDLEKLLDQGFDAHLAKPFSPRQLRATLEELLNGSRASTYAEPDAALS